MRSDFVPAVNTRRVGGKVKRYTRRQLTRLRLQRERERRAVAKEDRPTRSAVRRARNVDEMLKGCADR